MMTEADDEIVETEDEMDKNPEAIEPPALIGVIGAGPVGIEAALYARFLGYNVIVWDKAAEVAANVGADDSQTLPFSELVTPLALNALGAQSEAYAPRDSAEKLSAAEWKAEYLLPLSATDLIRKCFQLETEIQTVTVRENDSVEAEEDAPPRLFTITAANEQSWDQVAAVIDTAGPTPFFSGGPGYHILGAKSSTDSGEFTVRDGHHQVRKLFAQLGDRENLDLYQF